MLVAVEGKGHLLEKVLALRGSWLTQLRVRPARVASLAIGIYLSHTERGRL